MSIRNFERGNLCRRSRERSGKRIEATADFLEVSTRMINLYESGESKVLETKLLKMAEFYSDPLLPYNYWATNSLIAKHYGFKPYEQKSVFEATIEAGNSFNVISHEREEFMAIMEDGEIGSNERGKYEEIVKATRKSSMAVLFLDVLVNQKEKAVFAETA